MSSHLLKGIPIGQYPELLPEARIIYHTPEEFFKQGHNQLITIYQRDVDLFFVSFWTWSQDRRYKTEVKGTWYLEDVMLNKKQLHAFQRMDFGGMKIAGRSG